MTERGPNFDQSHTIYEICFYSNYLEYQLNFDPGTKQKLKYGPEDLLLFKDVIWNPDKHSLLVLVSFSKQTNFDSPEYIHMTHSTLALYYHLGWSYLEF